MRQVTMVLLAGVLVHTAAHAQGDPAAVAGPIARALAVEGHAVGPLVVAAMTDCARDLRDPSCEGARYPEARRTAADAMAAALANALNVPVSADAAAATRALRIVRPNEGSDAACHADGNVVRAVRASAPIADADGQTLRVGVNIQQLPLLEGCRSAGRLVEFTFRPSGVDGALELVGQRVLLSGTGLATVRGG